MSTRGHASVLSPLAAIIAVVFGLHATADSARITQDPLAMAGLFSELPVSYTLSGNYLAGRYAQRNRDWDAAQNYMSVVANLDPGNPSLDQRVFLLSVGAGQYDRARGLAEKIAAQKTDTDLAEIFLSCDAIRRGDYAAALKHIDQLPDDGFGQYTKPLLSVWAYAGQGRTAEAIAELSQHADATDPTFNIHAALISELAGDNPSAERYYKAAMDNGLSLHTAYLANNFFIRTGNTAMATAIREKLAEAYPFNPFVSAMAEDKENRTNISSAAQGAALAMMDLANLLFERHTYDSAQIYTGIVQMLDPASPFADLLMGDIQAVDRNYDKAVAAYEGIDEKSPVRYLARMRVTELLDAMGHDDKAISLLEQLSLEKPTRLQALVAIGDIHRRHKNFRQAIDAYDRALAGADKMTPAYWSVFYARGMALERTNDWPRAEKDLMTALKFQPNNPMILNFLGYSWLEKGQNLDKALDYTRRAAMIKPDDGYILDSYGWALYINGQYADAIEWLERATIYTPDEPTLLAHLGDAYWQTGRQNEARFKWRRAADVSTDAAFKRSLRQKISHGMDDTAPKTAHKEAKL